VLSALKKEYGKDIWLVGGGKLVSILLAADLIDEMQICYFLVILGEGIPLFPEQPKNFEWKLIEVQTYDSGVLKDCYNKKIKN